MIDEPACISCRLISFSPARGPDDTVRVVVVTADQVLESSDGGATFGALTTE